MAERKMAVFGRCRKVGGEVIARHAPKGEHGGNKRNANEAIFSNAGAVLLILADSAAAGQRIWRLAAQPRRPCSHPTFVLRPLALARHTADPGKGEERGAA
ncbi:hypothetical protein MRX96_010387 [Rhipicephalus microplus]